MRIGRVRVSRLALVAGDPFSIIGTAASIGRQLLGAGKGKLKRQAGGLAAKGIKSLALAGPGAVIGANLPGMMEQAGLPHAIGRAIGAAIAPARGGAPVMRNGVPTFPISVSRGRRRMNPLNARALRRAISRVQSFAKIARRTVQITTRVKLKKRRRR